MFTPRSALQFATWLRQNHPDVYKRAKDHADEVHAVKTIAIANGKPPIKHPKVTRPITVMQPPVVERIIRTKPLAPTPPPTPLWGFGQARRRSQKIVVGFFHGSIAGTWYNLLAIESTTRSIKSESETCRARFTADRLRGNDATNSNTSGTRSVYS